MSTPAPALERPYLNEERHQTFPDAPTPLLAGAEDDEPTESHIWRGID
ncbi:hypothetical protein [Streptomyces sp. AJS327]|nr:hypothetical protein [Streptomyces sp. AJS327]